MVDARRQVKAHHSRGLTRARALRWDGIEGLKLYAEGGPLSGSLKSWTGLWRASPLEGGWRHDGAGIAATQDAGAP